MLRAGRVGCAAPVDKRRQVRSRPALSEADLVECPIDDKEHKICVTLKTRFASAADEVGGGSCPTSASCKLACTAVPHTRLSLCGATMVAKTELIINAACRYKSRKILQQGTPSRVQARIWAFLCRLGMTSIGARKASITVPRTTPLFLLTSCPCCVACFSRDSLRTGRCASVVMVSILPHMCWYFWYPSLRSSRWQSKTRAHEQGDIHVPMWKR